ncbi:MAG TPA: segregation/condensation protein A [Anaerolineaceae bacterium]|nr:segregation/condensation protein A [Anaerolineaceae bacterium]HPN50216.1 segregation/condensation protein A [Anaerolineaceae bacterium]
MDFQVAAHQTEGYKIATDVFEGPLDLLLELIQKAQLDITRLALAQITDQYLAYLRQLQETNASEVSAFLIIAAKLIQIKSEALLPRPPERAPDEEDPGEALAQQLILYRQFKLAAQWAQQREAEHLRCYLRTAPGIKIEGKLDLAGLTIKDIVLAARAGLKMNQDAVYLSTVVAPPRVTIRERIKLILNTLQQQQRTSFFRLMKTSRNRIFFVVTFLAMLELIKRRIIEVQQDALFSDISISPIEENTASVDFETDFGE